MDLPIAILAGGLATRMRPMTESVPKSLLPVTGEPFIRHQLRLLVHKGCKHVVLCTGYLGEQIRAEVGDGADYGLQVDYSTDWPDLLGTGGALKKALPLLGSAFLVLYGDSYLDIAYADAEEYFLRSRKQGLMTVYRNNNQYDVSNVVFRQGEIFAYDKKQRTPEMEYIDYGLGALKASVLAAWPERAFDLADVYTSLAKERQLAGLEAFERFYEIGSVAGLDDLARKLSVNAGKAQAE